jgi:protocatechuate 4,5-dioxygenase alpha chain
MAGISFPAFILPFIDGYCPQRLAPDLIQNKSCRPTNLPKESAMPTPKSTPKSRQPVPGTTIFDGEQARKGFALNKMCYSFNDAANRRAFVADEDTYCAKYGLNTQQREAIRNRNVLQLIEAGGNAYYLAKFAGIFGLDMQDIGAQQTGLTKDQFKAKLLQAGA